MAENVETTDITQSQIDSWKKSHGEVFCVEVEDKKCYLKRPSRKALGAAAVLSGGDSIKYNEVILNNCWLGGDEEFKTEDAYFLGISQTLAELIEVKKATLKKV
ncbi:MAG: hypothetical protein SNJ29_07215 [Rikenellaceae bacterium]